MMATHRYKKIRTFILLSLFIGVFLSAVHGLGYFSKFDALLYGINYSGQSHAFFSLDGILAILLFAVIPGIGIILWGNEKGLLCSLGCLIAYYGVSWLYWKHLSRMLPLVAPAIATIACVVRAYGWRPALDGDKHQVPGRSVQPSHQGQKHAAFISYRREGGAETARLVRAELLKRGFNAFLDVEDLGASHFDERLFREIERAPNFILILSAGSLDPCEKEDDWLRKEINHAISTQRNIVPILKEGFLFPALDALPKKIAGLPRYNSVVYSHAYFDATMDKLVKFLKTDDA